MRRLERVYQNGTLAEVGQEELVASFQWSAGQPLSSHSATASDRQPTAKTSDLMKALIIVISPSQANTVRQLV